MWFPLLVLPLLIYNLVVFNLIGVAGLEWAAPILNIDMASGAVWTFSLADLLVIFALLLLLVEALRAPLRQGWVGGVLASGVTFGVYLAEFLIVPAAATSLFFTCAAMSFVDLVIRMFSTSTQPQKPPRPPRPQKPEKMDFNY